MALVDGRTRSPWTLAAQKNVERISTIGIWILIAYTCVKNVFAAASIPFWYDEILTVAVAHQPNLASVWNALTHAQDSSPPLYSLVEHACSMLVTNAQVAYRIPSIIAFACILWCLFVFIRRHEGGTCAFLCAAILVFTPLYKVYAIQARSYILTVACISFALVCYQRAEKRSWTVLLGLALVCAEAFHYYAFFAFGGFFIAELARIAKTRKIRFGVWLAFAAGFLPLIASWPLLMELKRFYGPDFWGKPSFKVVEFAYDGFFPAFILRLVPGLGFIFLAALSGGALLAGGLSKPPNGITERECSSHEPLLAIGLLGVPFVAYAAAELGHGTLAGRYLLSMLLGMVIAASYVLRLTRRRETVLFGMIAVVLFGAVVQETLFWRDESRHWASFLSPANSLITVVSSAGKPDLPVVVSPSLTYVEVAYYAPVKLDTRLVGIADNANAIKYTGNDSADRELMALSCCLALQAYEFSIFAKQHPTFLLYSGSSIDWWPARLRTDGYLLEPVASDGKGSLFLVNQGADLHEDRSVVPGERQ
jgi:4-amino-4-deoxy-L-arabinose transferase-like glycosyltransferase